MEGRRVVGFEQAKATTRRHSIEPRSSAPHSTRPFEDEDEPGDGLTSAATANDRQQSQTTANHCKLMFDPTLPQAGTEIDAVQMRGQLNGLKDLIDAIQSIGSATVDGVNTLTPGEPAEVTLTVSGGTLHFTFGIPAGADGGDGGQGIQGEPGMPGMPGAPGEVSFQQLADAIATTSSTSNGVGTLGMAVSDPPTHSEMQQIADKLDELINALRR